MEPGSENGGPPIADGGVPPTTATPDKQADHQPGRKSSRKKSAQDEEESKGTGAVNPWFYSWVASKAGRGLLVGVVLGKLCENGLRVLSEYVVGLHGEGNDARSADHSQPKEDNLLNILAPWAESTTTNQHEASGQFLTVYGACQVLLICANLGGFFMLVKASVSASRKLHVGLLKALCAVKVAFFEETPAGRIVNRFSADFDMIDHQVGRIVNRGFRRTST